MKIIFLPTATAIIAMNKYICEVQGNLHQCIDSGKIESAISTAFYPGNYPFAHGGLAKVAGALCFYLVRSHPFIDGNKRTGALAAVTFLNQHGIDLGYPLIPEKDINDFADVIEGCAAGKINKEQLMEWFENHKMALEDE